MTLASTTCGTLRCRMMPFIPPKALQQKGVTVIYLILNLALECGSNKKKSAQRSQGGFLYKPEGGNLGLQKSLKNKN